MLQSKPRGKDERAAGPARLARYGYVEKIDGRQTHTGKPDRRKAGARQMASYAAYSVKFDVNGTGVRANYLMIKLSRSRFLISNSSRT
jgi:hypothetical protein